MAEIINVRTRKTLRTDFDKITFPTQYEGYNYKDQNREELYLAFLGGFNLGYVNGIELELDKLNQENRPYLRLAMYYGNYFGLGCKKQGIIFI